MRHFIIFAILTVLSGCAETLGNFGNGGGEIVDPHTGRVVAGASFSGGHPSRDAAEIARAQGRLEIDRSYAAVNYAYADQFRYLWPQSWNTGPYYNQQLVNVEAAAADAWKKNYIIICIKAKGKKDDCAKEAETEYVRKFGAQTQVVYVPMPNTQAPAPAQSAAPAPAPTPSPPPVTAPEPTAQATPPAISLQPAAPTP